jgi:hypothetical protein
MRYERIVALAAVLLLGAPPAARADVRLSISDGRVTLKASGATLREILAEWAKVGQTRIVNLERVPGGPVTLELTDVPEREALDILLRSVSGYVAAPRATTVGNASQFDRILVLPTSAPPRAAAVPPPAFASSPVPAPFNAQPPPAGEADDNQEDQPRLNPRGPAFTAFPPPVTPRVPQESAPEPAPAQPVNTAQPGMSVGASVPGMTVPTPQSSEQEAPQPRDF